MTLRIKSHFRWYYEYDFVAVIPREEGGRVHPRLPDDPLPGGGLLQQPGHPGETA